MTAGEVIAEHRRRWGREGVPFDPVHYLELLERKPGELDHARPPKGWALPGCFAVLRRRLEADRDGGGTREYIRGSVQAGIAADRRRPVARRQGS
jgi:hypothetical protein